MAPRRVSRVIAVLGLAAVGVGARPAAVGAADLPITTVQSRYGDATTIVTGKIVVGEQLVLQRQMPLEVSCAGTEVVNEVRIEFLNPGGTHYDFMGREHSLALVLQVPQDTVRSLLA